MPKHINALYKFVIKIPIAFRRKDMKFKKILSSFLAFAVAFGAVSFAPFGKNGKFGGKNVKLYSGWSKAKAVTTKK